MIKEKIKSGEQYYYTTNLKAAVALATTGFKLKSPPISRTTRDDGRESVVFWFETLNGEGRSAEDVVRSVTKEADVLNASDPENPLNYIRAALMNRDVLVTLLKQTPKYVVVETNGKRIALREDATEEDRRRIAARV